MNIGSFSPIATSVTQPYPLNPEETLIVKETRKLTQGMSPFECSCIRTAIEKVPKEQQLSLVRQTNNILKGCIFFDANKIVELLTSIFNNNQETLLDSCMQYITDDMTNDDRIDLIKCYLDNQELFEDIYQNGTQRCDDNERATVVTLAVKLIVSLKEKFEINQDQQATIVKDVIDMDYYRRMGLVNDMLFHVKDVTSFNDYQRILVWNVLMPKDPSQAIG